MRLLGMFYLCLFCVFGTVVSASAQSPINAPYHFTGSDLNNLCHSHYDTDYGLCAGYVTGIADVMLQQDVYGASACGHRNVKSEQLIALVNRYLENNPKAHSIPARDVVSLTLARAFPCD